MPQSAAYLRELRRKYGLGEFAKRRQKASSRRRTQSRTTRKRRSVRKRRTGALPAGWHPALGMPYYVEEAPWEAVDPRLVQQNAVR